MDRPNLLIVPSIGSDGTFSGYACLFGEEVRGAVIVKGAFEASLEKRQPKMLWNHDPAQPVGKWLEAGEVDAGLRVRGQLDLNVERGRELKSLIETGAINGLSISFNVLESTTEDGVQKITKVDLWEISLCTFPAQEEAQVDEDTVQMYDTLALDGTRRTADGYVAANARAARTGIQVYRGSEVGRPDLDRVRIYRPESEVFNKDSLRSYAHRPMTNDHPPVAVNSSNWKRYSVGQTGDEVIRDGDHVRVPLVLMDAQAIKDYEGGKKQLSLGYLTKLKWGAGVTPSGQAYDATQTEIRANHLALVTGARGGPSLTIGDERREGEYLVNDRTVQLKTLTIDGLPVEMTDMAATVVNKHIGTLERAIESLKAKLAAEEDNGKKAAKDAETVAAAHVTALATKDAEITTLKKQVSDSTMTPARLDQLVKDRSVVIERATKILGDKLVVDGKTEIDIRRQVVDSVLGDSAKGWNEDQVTASFNTIAASDSFAQSGGNPPVRTDRLADALSRPGTVQTSDAAYGSYEKELTNRWKTPAAVQ